MRTVPSLALLVVVFGMLTSATAASKRHALFVSDLHVGAGKTSKGDWRRIEDFRWQNEFDQFLQFVAKKSGNTADIVFVGDVFELWQSPTMVCSEDPAKIGCEILDCMETSPDFGCSEAEALARFKYVLGQHEDFVASLRTFANSGTNRVFFIPGNHDAALLFPALKAHLIQQFEPARVTVTETGSWLSEDGAIYADHGINIPLLRLGG